MEGCIKMKKIIIGLLILMVVLVGCLPPSDITPSKDIVEEVVEEVNEEGMDINEMYEVVKTGMTFNEVKAILGEPSNVQKMESDIGGMMEIEGIETKMTMEMWYYQKGFNMLQVSFTNGKVSGKMTI